MGIAYTKTATSLTLVVGFRPTVIPSSHPNFAKLVDLAKRPDTTEAMVKPLLDIPAAITSFTGGEITVYNGKLFYRGSEVKNNLASIILGFVKSGDETAAEPFKRFLANCRQNPDLALVDTIYDWCVKGNLPITPEGELIAWKVVGRDYMSLRAGKRGHLRHRIGDVVTEPREECDPNRNQTCSTGIHFASLEYLQSGAYGGGANSRYMAVVINPADITAIPTDYNLSKGRCCKLRVVGEVPREQMDGYYGAAKVYDWTPSKPKARFPVKVGDVWRTKDGRQVRIESTSGSGTSGTAYVRDIDTERYIGAVFTDDGTSHRHGAQRLGHDLVELISDAKTPRNTSGIAVGQVWAQRNGNEVTISEIGYAHTLYPVVDDRKNYYTVSGRYNSDTTVSQFDLVRLVKDVD